MEENYDMVLRLSDDGIEYLKNKIRELESGISTMLKYNNKDNVMPMLISRNKIIKKYKRAVKEKQYPFEPGNKQENIMLQLFYLKKWIIIE